MNDNSESTSTVSLYKINAEHIANIPISDKVTINNFYDNARKQFYPTHLLPIDKIIYNGEVLNELDDETILFSKISNDNDSDTLNSSVEMNVMLDERNLVDIYDMQGQIIEKVYFTEHMTVNDLYQIMENNTIVSEYNFSWSILFRDIYCHLMRKDHHRRNMKIRHLFYYAEITPLIVVSSTRLTEDNKFKLEESDMIFYDINDFNNLNEIGFACINIPIIKDFSYEYYPIYIFLERGPAINKYTTVGYYYFYDNKGKFMEKIIFYE